jgi:hypothetical protein
MPFLLDEPDYFTEIIVFSDFLLNAGEKAGGANHKLVGFPLQHHRGFSGGQSRPVPQDVRFASE